MPKSINPSRKTGETVEMAMQALLESLPEAALIMHPEGLILNINNRFSERFGMAPEICTGRNIYDLIINVLGVPVLANYLKEKCALVLASGTSMVFEDDTDVWKVSINPVRSAAGEISSFFMIVEDVSGQKRRDRQLQKERELKTTMLDAIPCSAVIFDSNLSLMASNRYAEELLCTSGESGRPQVDPEDFFTRKDIDPLKEIFLEAMRSGNESDCEMEIHPGGKPESAWLMTRSKRLFIDGEPCLVSIGFDITERKKIEQDLASYREKLTMALQASHAGIWEWYPDTDGVDWSDEVWQLYGLDKTQGPPSLKLWEQVVHPEDHGRSVKANRLAAEQMRNIEFEYRVRLRDGAVRWLLSRGRPSADEPGRPVRYVGTVIDITERKELELELQKNKKMMDQALGASRVGVWERDLKTNIVIWSDTLWQLLGIEKGDQALSFSRWVEIVHPDDRDKAIHAVNAATSNGLEMNVEYRICHPDGSIHWLMSRGKPLFEQDGTIVRYIGSVIDITELKLLEQELLESKLRYGYALDAAHTGIWEWNIDTDQLNWSEQVWTLYGLKPGSSALNHQLCVDTIHPEDRDMVSRIIKDAVRDSNAASVEYRTCHPDGSIHWLTSRGMPMYDGNGKLKRYIGAVIDITERKQIELALIESKRRLGQALEAARAGVWEWDTTTNENVWSDETWPLYGIDRKEGLSPSFELWTSTIHPDDLEPTIGAVTDAVAGQADVNIEYRVCLQDNSVHWLMSRGKPVIDEQGRTIRYIGTIIDITEKKLAELALNESRLRFNFALEATKAGIWEWDMKSDRVTWSDQIWGLYGLEPFSVKPSHRLCESNVHAEDRELTFAQVMSAASHDDEFTVEYRVAHPDGAIRWLMCHGVPLPGTDGQTGCYLGTVMDITERRLADEELRKSQKKLNFVLSKSNIGVWDLDLADHKAYRSLEHARIFGYHDNTATWTLEVFLSHIVKEDRQRVESQMMQAFENAENYTFECRICTADGKVRWIWVFGAFDSDMHGKARHLYGIVQDITERKRTELLLKENEQKFRNIFDFSPIAICIEDPDAGIVFDVNGSWLKLFDFTREEVVGRRVQELGIYPHPEDHAQIATALHEQGRILNRPFELRSKTGAIVIVLLSAEFITMNNQTRMLVMMTDITVQELQQANISQLEKVVSDRTEQLRQEVERLHRFLSMISHEYRTPLAIIRGNLDLIDLKHKGGNYSNERETAKIKRAIDRLVEVMEVSIQESRLLESPKSTQAEAFMIETAITSQVEAVLSMWPERHIRSHGDLAEAMTFGEAAQLKMAIFNLLDNARKYSPSGTAIDIERHLEDGSAIITIRNKGKGFTDIEGKELFEKYRRGSNAADTGGAGIGLWLVKNIVEQHHGQVTLKGTSSGVEAVIRLPLLKNPRQNGNGI
ncbi:MAG: PAS domain-containing protein [Chlorobiaceae bacterium]|nr:PAS domain-containing protein [Chlorobiaceae bacterium]